MSRAIRILCLIGIVFVSALLFFYYRQKMIQVVEVVPCGLWQREGGRPLKVGEMDFDSDFRQGQYRDKGNDCYFAIRGEIARRFIPWQFHSVYAEIQGSKADENCVYIHRYNRRYLVAVRMP